MEKTRHINYKSDFKILFTLTGACIGVPFRWFFNVGRTKYFCERTADGRFINCDLVDATHVEVYFSGHNFPIGNLEAEYRFYFKDESFADKICNFVSRNPLNVVLWDGCTDSDDIEINTNVLVNALRGYSAYELAVQNGYSGTLEEWLATGGWSQEQVNSILEQVQRKVDESMSGVTTDINNLKQGQVETDRKINNDVIPNLLSMAQQDWINGKMQDEKRQEANTKFIVSTSIDNSNPFYTDTTKAENIIAKVSAVLSFDGSTGLSADFTPIGWNKNDTVYEYRLNVTNRVAASVIFDYTVPNGIYKDIKVSHASEQKSISVINPAYHGFVPSKNVEDVNTFIKSLSRITSNVDTNTKLQNPDSVNDRYYWILTKGSASASQVGSPILELIASDVAFVSPVNSQITMSGYKLYITENSCAPSGSFDDVNLKINL